MLEWLSTTDYATGVRESLWGWPLALTVHAFGTAVVIGLMAIICLRLFGLFQTISFVAIKKLIPIIWIAVVFQAASGFTLWMTKPAQYLADGMFEVKITFVIAGVIVTIFFQRVLIREAATWDGQGTVSARGLKFVAATALVWAGVLVAGRLTAYLGQLYMS